MGKATFITGILIWLLSLLVAFGNEPTPEKTQATAFFRQLMMESDNPIIADMARENLSQLSQEEIPVSFERQHIEVPLLSPTRNNLTVSVLLNNEVRAAFLVDTGATHSVITPQLARRLGIRINSRTPTMTLQTANGITTVPTVILESVRLGNAEIKEVKAVIQNLGEDLLLGGLLGMNTFDGMDLTIKEDRLILSKNSASTP